jgi:Chalcone isomerase-like
MKPTPMSFSSPCRKGIDVLSAVRRQRFFSWGMGLVACHLTLSLAHASPALLPGAKPSSQQRLSIWGFDIYDARLWVRPGFSVASYSAHAFVLEVSYLRNLEGESISKKSIDEMRKVGPFSREQESNWLKAMLDIFPNVQKGDRLQAVYAPNAGAEFFLNDKVIGRIQDPLFAQLFFGIWLHESTSAPALRQAWMKGL